MEWIQALVLILLGLMVIMAIVWVLKNEPSRIRNWMVSAVTEAEKQFGSGTGQLKLKTVYSWFIQRFPFVSMFLSFETFSSWVDLALKEMRHLIATNPAIKSIVEKGE